MKFDKLIFFRYIPLTQKVYEDFYIKEVDNLGLKVEYWDFSAILFDQNFGQEDASDLMNVVRFTNYEGLEQALQREYNRNTLFISLVTCDGLVIKFFSLLTRYNCRLAFFARNVLPAIPRKDSFFYKLKSIAAVNKTKIECYLRDRKLVQLKEKGEIKGYDIVFLAGNKGCGAIGCTTRKEIEAARIIKINSDDYDRCLKYQATQRLVEGDYILFLDQYLPLHPDLKLLKLKSVDHERYYRQLNAFFDRVEQQFSVPVVIAAHPKALAYRECDFWNGRRMFFEKSMELCRNAVFVLAHNSTSVNLSVVFDVKLHFITSHDIEKEMNYIHQYTLKFADCLNCHWQYFDEMAPVNLVDQLPQAAYDQYKQDYLTSPETRDKYTEQIFVDFLRSAE